MNEIISNHFRLYAGVNSSTGTLSGVSTEVYSNIKFTGASSVTIEGFSGVQEEKIIFIHNLTGSILTVKNETGALAYQINTGLNVDFNLADGASLALIYIGGQWRPLAPLSLSIGSVQSFTVTPSNTVQFNLGTVADFLYGKYVLNIRKSTLAYYSSEVHVARDQLSTSGFYFVEYAVIGSGIDFSINLDASGLNVLLEITNNELVDIDVILDMIVTN